MKTYHFKLEKDGFDISLTIEAGNVGTAINQLSNKHHGFKIIEAYHGMGGEFGGRVDLFELHGREVPPKVKPPKPVSTEFYFIESVDQQCGTNKKHSAQKAGL